MIVHGRIRSLSRWARPCTVWKNWLKRKTEPNIPKNISSDATFASVKTRLRKKRIGSIGASARSPRHEQRQHDGAHERPDDLRRRPAPGVAADEPPDDSEQAAARQRHARQSSLFDGRSSSSRASAGA
jgi:hypothetical protein